MAAGKYTFACEQGATFNPVLTWRQANPDPDSDVPGDPVDLTGYTARMHVREAVASEDTKLVFTTENGKIILGGAAGTIELLLSATETAAIDLGEAHKGVSWKFDLELVSAGGVVKRLLKGSFKVDPEVTR